MSRHGDPSDRTDVHEAIMDARRAEREQLARGIGPQDCTCGVVFDDEFSRDREAWHAVHVEAAVRRGDTALHVLEPF